MGDSKQFVIDERGNRVKVLVDIEEYKRLLEEAEELESIRAYDEAKAADDEAIPLDDALREIENTRREK